MSHDWEYSHVVRSQWSFGCFRKFTLAFYSDFRALSPECARAQNNEFTSAQQPLYMAGVSKRRQKKLN